MEILIILAVVICIAVVGAMSGNKKVKEIPVIDEPKTESRLILSEDFEIDVTTSKKENNHMITTFYLYKDDHRLWICPNCEAENSVTKKQCGVCQHTI